VTATTAAAVAAAAGGRHVLISRGIRPGIRSGLVALGVDLSEIPAVRCVAAAPRLEPDEVFVGGCPNHLGGFDPIPDPTVAVVRVPGPPIHGTPRAVVVDRDPGWRAFGAATATARALAKHLDQIRGVRLVCRPASPIVIVLTPRSAERFEGLGPFPTTALDGYPELPGGVRIEIPDGFEGIDVAAYAERFARRVAGEEER